MRIEALLKVLLLTFVLATGCQKPAPPLAPPALRPSTASVPVKVDVQHLPNAIRVHEKVISGGLPEGDAAFQELQSLGVKTIISVDGAKPDVARAKQFGMRYVHLPHGYDGISAERSVELAKAVRDLPGPIYLHCHHGKHRSPAAAAVACVATGLVPHEQALNILKLAGTSENYRGLYQAADITRRIDDRQLDALPADFPETAKLPLLAESMVVIEHTHDQLKALAKNDWKPTAKHPDLTAPHEALLLREHFTELLRANIVQSKPERFLQLLRDGEAACKELESLLHKQPDEWSSLAQQSFGRITKNCTSCHREFRDSPRETSR